MVTDLLALIIVLYGGLVSRIHGGGILDIPKIMANFLWAFPFGIIVFLIYDIYFDLTTSISYGILCTLVTMILKGTGHGQYFNLGNYTIPNDKPEMLDPIVEVLCGKETPDNKFGRDLVGLAVVGAAAVLPTVLLLLPVNFFLAVILFIGGASKAAAYFVGWALFYPNQFPSPTNVGEVLSGVVAFAALGNALFHYI